MSHTPNMIQLPNALIYSSDTDAIIPLREYLSHFGCQVFVNIRLSQEPEYFFVIGTDDFVTDILEKSQHLSCKILGIVWSYETLQIHKGLKNTCKLAVVAPDVWNQKTIEEIIQFLVISKDQFLGIGLGPQPPVVIKKQEEPKYLHTKITHPSIAKIVQEKSLPIQENIYQEAPPLQHAHLTSIHPEPSKDIRRISQIIASLYPPSPKRQHAFRLTSISKMGFLLVTLLLIGICCLLPYVFLFYHASVVVSCIKNSHASCIDKESSLLSRVVPWVASYDGFISESVSILLPNKKLPTTTFVSGMILTTDILSRFPTYRQEGQTFLRGVVSGDTQVPVLSLSQKLLRQTQDLTRLARDVRTLMSEMESLPVFPFGHVISVSTGSIKDDLSTLIGTLTQIEQLLSLYPVIGGFRTPVTYGVIFQNAGQLRPTGGLIQTVVVLTMDGGVISAKKVEDVALLDAGLRGHIAPPAPIQHILGQEHWYLGDSNWDPDFPTTAQKILWFYEKETGKALDGIIATTTQTIRNYLTNMGPLPLPDTQIVLTSDNFHEHILRQPETNILKNSSDTQHILGSTIETIHTSVSGGDGKAREIFSKTLIRSLETRETALYFPTDSLQQMVRLYGWERGVPKIPDCLGVSQKLFVCRGLPVQINEANLSSSALIPIITRSQSREIIIDEMGMVTQYTTRTITNDGANNENASYTAYLQFVFDQNMMVESVTVNGKTINQGQPQAPGSFPYWETSIQQNRLIAGVALITTPGESASITVSVKSETPLSFGPRGAFLEITTQRQAGIPTIPTSTIIRYPHQWTMSTLRGLLANSLAIQGQLEYNSDLSQDETMFLILKKNP